VAVPRSLAVTGSLTNDIIDVSSYLEYYGLSGDDTFNTSSSTYGSLLSGGLGDDNYNIAYGANVIVHDTGGTDTITSYSTYLSDPYLYVGFLDNAHMVAANTLTGQFFAVADWFDPEKRIDTFRIGDGTYTYDQINYFIHTAPNFLGYISTESYGPSILGTSVNSADVRNFVTSITQDEDRYTGTAFTSYLPSALSDEGVNLVRFYNTALEAFFYTASPAEAEAVRTNLPYFQEHGPVFNVLDAHDTTTADTVEVYRFLNTSTGGHFFTSNQEERDIIIDNVNGDGFLASLQYEGVAYKAFNTDAADRTAVYRLFDPESGSHALSASSTEIVGMQANGFQMEGIAFWGYS